jgi:hypothetical protein
MYNINSFNKNRSTTFVTGSGKPIQRTTKILATKTPPKQLFQASNDASNTNTTAKATKQTSIFHEPTETILFGKQITWNKNPEEDILSSQLTEQEQETQGEAFKAHLESSHDQTNLHQDDNPDSEQSTCQSEDNENEIETEEKLHEEPDERSYTNTDECSTNGEDNASRNRPPSPNKKVSEVNIMDIDFRKLEDMERKSKENERTLRTVTPGKTTDPNAIWNPYKKSYASTNQDHSPENVQQKFTPLFSFSSSDHNHLYQSRFISSDDTLDTAKLNPIIKKHPELAAISALFKSQHNAYATIITELGIKTLDFTTMIETKKRMFNKMKDGFLPSSIRIKCHLTTSEDYRQDETFLLLKRQQDQNVTEFHQKSLEVFKSWHDKLINLLIKDRLIYLLVKGTAVLSRMINYFQHCINPKVNWLSASNTNSDERESTQKMLTLFFFKLYTSERIINISPLLQFLDISIKEFTSVGAKLILNTNDDSKVEREFNQLNILKFNPTKKTEFEFVQEVILSFDSILRFTSLELWNAKNLAERQATASEALEASLKADDTANTTELVAETIMKAKHKISNSNELQTNLELRMANLEKLLAKQQQQQKNSKGGRSERRSSHTLSKTAPLTYKSHNQNSRNTVPQPKGHQSGQTHTKIQPTNKLEPSTSIHQKQRTKHTKSHTEKPHLQNSEQPEKRATEFSKNSTHNNRKRKFLLPLQEQTSDSNSLTSQSTTSEPTIVHQNKRRHQKQSHQNQDAKLKGQNAAFKRRQH